MGVHPDREQSREGRLKISQDVGPGLQTAGLAIVGSHADSEGLGLSMENDPLGHSLCYRQPDFSITGRGTRLSNKINATKSTVPLIWTALIFETRSADGMRRSRHE
jgi:hypothetical protein